MLNVSLFELLLDNFESHQVMGFTELMNAVLGGKEQWSLYCKNCMICMMGSKNKNEDLLGLLLEQFLARC